MEHMSDFLVAVAGILAPLVILPWIIFHYITKWKKGTTLTTDDEQLLQDLYDHARRLDDRLEVIERLALADNPHWKPSQQLDSPDDRLERLDALERGRTPSLRS